MDYSQMGGEVSRADFNALRFIEYAKAMQRVEDAGVNSKSAADKILAEVEPVSALSISPSRTESPGKTEHSRVGLRRNYRSGNSSSRTA
jgi:hypothetical protein